MNKTVWLSSTHRKAVTMQRRMKGGSNGGIINSDEYVNHIIMEGAVGVNNETLKERQYEVETRLKEAKDDKNHNKIGKNEQNSKSAKSMKN